MLKNITQSLLDATRKVVEQSDQKYKQEQEQRIAKLTEKAMKPASSGTAPRNDQERKLAAMTPPKDKITHGDVLHGRGVKKEETEQIEEKAEDVEQVEEAMSHQASTTMKHISNPTAGEKKAAKDIKPGVAGYRDRIAMLKSAEARGALKKEDVEQTDEAVSPQSPHNDLAGRIRFSPFNKTAAGKKREFDRGTERLKDKMKFTKSQGGIAGPKGKLPEEVEHVEEAGKVAPGSPFSKDYKPQGDKPGEKAGFTSKKISTGTVYSRKPAKDMKENTDTPGNSYQHQCAIHVKSEQFGEGKTIYSQHAEPDSDGNIAWYDVMFEHGIEKQVPTDKLEILVSESHMSHKKKKK